MPRTKWPLVALLCVVVWQVTACTQSGQSSLDPVIQHVEWTRYMVAGMSAWERGRHAEAEKWLRKAVKVAEPSQPEDARLGMSLILLADLYFAEERLAKAQPLLERAVHTLERSMGPEHPLVAISLLGLATSHLDRFQGASAEPLFQRALKILESSMGPDHPLVVISLLGLAQSYFLKFEREQAEALFERALAIVETTADSDLRAGMSFSLGEVTKDDPSAHLRLRDLMQQRYLPDLKCFTFGGVLRPRDCPLSESALPSGLPRLSPPPGIPRR